MRRRGPLFVLLLLCLPVCPVVARGDDEVPQATHVVLRGKTDLFEALQAAAYEGAHLERRKPPEALVVVDVTPNTQRAQAGIADALARLAVAFPDVAEWSVAALDAKPHAIEDGDWTTPLEKVMAEETDVAATLPALERSIKAWRRKDAFVVYLADWRFEDDVDLEGFIAFLQKKKLVLSVVGSEAAFGRGWNDGFREGGEHMPSATSMWEDYWEGIGRDPFGRPDAQAPWHGGDTAYPGVPYRWMILLWATSFSATDWEIADLEAKGPTDPGAFLEGMGRLGEAFVELAGASADLAEAELRYW